MPRFISYILKVKIIKDTFYTYIIIKLLFIKYILWLVFILVTWRKINGY